MRLERIIYAVLIIAATAVAAVNWRKAAFFQADNELLRAKLDALESDASQSEQAAEIVKASAERLKTQTSELMRLRDEVTQLRAGAKNAESLAGELQRLRAANLQLQAKAAAPAPPAPSPAASENTAGRNQFPRESWNFAGYASPEAALVSAIWAMREGDPRTYLESLAPEEQQRVAQTWQNKSEAEIAEKHKGDVAAISNIRVLEQNVGPNEVMMSVYLEGPNRVEKIRMNQVGQEWKFGGFIREAQQPAPAP